MLNIIQNTIGAIRRVGESVVRAGLKMWLPFTKAEPLGEELVVNGDFATDSDWTESAGSGWTISNGKASNDGSLSGNDYLINSASTSVVGKTYKVVFTVSDYVQGRLRVRAGQSSSAYANANGTYTQYQVSTNTETVRLQAIDNFIGSIDNVSVEEYAQETPDISSNNNNAILNTGKALKFHANDSLQTSFPTSKDIKTIAFWIYPTASNTNETLFWFGGAAGGDKYIDLDHLVMESDANNNINFDVYIDGVLRGETNYGGNNPTLTINQWQRVVLTTDTAINTTNDKLYIAHKDAGAFGRFKMSDLQVYGAEWSTDDIAYDYANPQKFVTDNTSSSISLSNLKGYWAFTEGAGSIAYDSSGGTAYNGTISGGTFVDEQERILQLGMISWAKSTPVSDEIVLPYSPNNVTQDILGNAVRVKGSGFNLDGTGYGEVLDDNVFDIPACNSVDEGAFSFMGWSKFNYIVQAASSFNVIYSHGLSMTSVGSFAIASENNNKIAAFVNGNYITTTTTQNVGDWVHFALTRDVNGSVKLYVNKTLENTISQTNAISNIGSKKVGWDSTANDRFYHERIDDVKFYNRELSSDEVEQNYNATKSGHNN